MIQSKLRFPLWIICVIAVLFSLALILGNILAVKYIITDIGKPIQYGPFYILPSHVPVEKEHIIAIATIITPTAIVIVNIFLVVITFYYARQTAIMVDEYNKTRKESIKPIFVPVGAPFKHVLIFILTNIGDVALMVKVRVKRMDDNRVETRAERIVDTSQELRCNPPGKDRRLSAILQICFRDKESTIYVQTIAYNSEHGYDFDKSSLPCEVREEPWWAKSILG